MESPFHYAIAQHRTKNHANFAPLSTGKIGEQIYSELTELASRVGWPQFDGKRVDRAADVLAGLAIFAAQLLEYLAFSGERDERVNLGWAAKEKNSWPVLLRLGVKQNRNGQRTAILEGAKKAKEYLSAIQLGKNATQVLRHLADRKTNPFKMAAELLLHELCRWRESGAWREPVTSWGRKLLFLEYPMTAKNVGEWWSLAKAWMDEQWTANPDLFEPLIKHLSLDRKKHTPSLVKRQVIDDSLKKAFLTLAVPDDL
ncbi:MAG: hypothetical protein JWQ04_1132 [Pedosphaera sp.]|nr:hypothetical protein [Pedosphaera sp.]